MKPFVVAAALEKGVIRASDRIDCEGGSWRVPGKTIRDFHPHGVLDVEGVIRVSSNIGAAKIGYASGPEFHYDVLRRFGFGARDGHRLPRRVGGPAAAAGRAGGRSTTRRSPSARASA